MRKVVVVVCACVASMFVLAVAGPFHAGGGPSVAEAAPAVSVKVDCRSNPEVTQVRNNTGRQITVRAVGSIHEPRSNEPFRVNRTLKAGGAVAFQSGYDARKTCSPASTSTTTTPAGAKERASSARWGDSSVAADLRWLRGFRATPRRVTAYTSKTVQSRYSKRR